MMNNLLVTALTLKLEVETISKIIATALLILYIFKTKQNPKYKYENKNTQEEKK
jgi:hypothetical protein